MQRPEYLNLPKEKLTNLINKCFYSSFLINSWYYDSPINGTAICGGYLIKDIGKLKRSGRYKFSVDGDIVTCTDNENKFQLIIEPPIILPIDITSEYQCTSIHYLLSFGIFEVLVNEVCYLHCILNMNIHNIQKGREVNIMNDGGILTITDFNTKEALGKYKYYYRDSLLIELDNIKL